MSKHSEMWGLLVCLSLALFASVNAAEPRVTFEYFPAVGYYYHYATNIAWGSGHKFCLDQGSDLAVINSEAEADVIQKIVSRVNKTMWVGVSDLLVPGQHVTVTGERVERTGYNQWFNGSASTDPALRCVYYNPLGGYQKGGCAGLLNVICEKQVWSGDYTLIPSLGYYAVHQHAATWEDAWTRCEAEGAHLVVINSAYEHSVVQYLLETHTVHPDADYTNYFHVGVHSKYGNGYFVTVDGKPLAKSGYNSWESPPNSNGIWAGLKLNGSYAQMSADYRLDYVCEHALP